MRSTRVVVVDDSAEMGETLARYLAGHAFDVDTCQHGGDAVARVAQGGVDAVLTDLRMPGTDGMDVLAGVKAADPGVPVIIMTAFGAVDSAVEAMQRGAFHYITNPSSWRWSGCCLSAPLRSAGWPRKTRRCGRNWKNTPDWVAWWAGAAP